METKFWQMSVDKPDLKMIKEATLLREGQVVAFPTETVYGLGPMPWIVRLLKNLSSKGKT